MNDIGHIIILIELNSTWTKIRIDRGAVVSHIIGRCTTVVDMSETMVEILTKDSSLDKAEVDPNAKARFDEAADELLSKGRIFYTALRANWCLPVVKWTLE